jgi:predicted acylesterase/phospholipase RssA
MSVVKERASKPGPKRILALDGGGIRGCLSLGYLQHIEMVVRQQLRSNKAVLADYFDLIGGTSTGALIAAQLALGSEVKVVREHYRDLGPKVFSKLARWARLPLAGKMLFTKWSVKPLQDEIVKIVSEKTTLGSPAMKTGLCIVTKRADTFSTWPFINHPDGKFFEDNGEIPLWKLLRASSAAPTFFEPIEFDIGVPTKPDFGIFVDGGVSMANNPALQLFLVATLKGFPFRWCSGADNLLLVSVGTGFWKRRLARTELLHPRNIFWAKTVPEMLMLDASDHTELIMQYLSKSVTTRPIDYEVGDLSSDVLGDKPALTYLRYNVQLESKAEFLKQHPEADPAILERLGRLDQKGVDRLREMDRGSNAEELLEIGDVFAAAQMKAEHFPASFAADLLVTSQS